jgi:molecular chaperone DnaJ
MSDLFGNTGGAGPGLGDLLGGIFGGAGGRGTRASASRGQRGADVESELRIDFTQAVQGAEVPIRLSAPGRCQTCAGSGARPGTTPRQCPTCAGRGLISRNEGAFAFSEPCPDCRGTGRIIDDPCPECGGDGVSTRTRSLTVRIPAGVDDGQRIRLPGQGEPGRGGAPAGDLYVKVHVTPHPLFGRSAKSADDITLTVPVTYPELVLGSTITVPTLDAPVTLRIPPGTASGRTLRVRGRGVQKRTGPAGDLLVTVEVAVPNRLDDAATKALQEYSEATKAVDPRAHLLGGAGR